MSSSGKTNKNLDFFLQDRQKTRIEGLRRALQLTDKILYGKDLKLQFIDDPNQLPASSTKEDVSINLGRISQDPLSAEGMAIILGLNYHEVAHMLYSPKRLDEVIPYRGYQNSNTYRRKAFMALEEHRVETIYCARYPRMRKWFTYPCMEFLVGDQSMWPKAFLYTHGRKYLSVDIRDKFREIFEGTSKNTDKYAELIDRYRILSIAQDAPRAEAIKIIDDFADLLQEDDIDPPDFMHQGSPQLGGDKGTARQQKADADQAASEADQEAERDEEARKQRKAPKKPSEEPESPEEDEPEDEERDGDSDEDNEPDDTGPDPEDAPGDEEDESDEESDSEDGDGEQPEPPADDTEDDSGSGGDSEEDGDSKSSDESSDSQVDGTPDDDDVPSDEDSGTGKPDAGDGDDENSDSGAEHEEGSPGGGVNNGVSSEPEDSTVEPPTQEELDDLAAALAGAMSEILNDEQVQRELATLENAMDDTGALSSTLSRNRQNSKLPVTPDMLANSGRVADVLRQLWAQMEAGWEYGTSEGARIDMNRAASVRESGDYESIYDDWNPGQQENSGFEGVILVDESWSTKEPMDRSNYGLGSIDQVASRNLWELKHALQEIDAFVTVLTFNTSCSTLYDREDRVTAAEYIRLVGHGNTDPTDALREARRILNASEQPNKLLIILTDGEWYPKDAQMVADTLQSMAGEVTRMTVLLGGLQNFGYMKYFDLVAKSSGEILDPMSQVVLSIMDRAIGR